MFCPNCGAQTFDAANFCQKCGDKLPTSSLNKDEERLEQVERWRDRFGSYLNLSFIALFVFSVIRYADTGMPFLGAIARAIGFCIVAILAGVAYTATGSRAAKGIYIAIVIVYWLMIFIDISQE